MKHTDPTEAEIAAICAQIHREKRLCNRCHRPNVELLAAPCGGWVCVECKGIDEAVGEFEDWGDE